MLFKESGHILPPAVRRRRPASFHLHPPLPLLLIHLLFPTPPPLNPPIFPGLRQRTCDDRGFSTGHGNPLLPFCSHWPRESIHSSPFSVPINLLSMFPGSTFLPIKSFHCPALQESGYTGL
ncbi:hypothetical protein CesoFtcFv8_017418 [Champsocephalus esox]|uniref:Uncharacterized protein n=2 Tax=Champsocephalus TaxID=52236 RepID=A0AAN8D9X5_CHAGU|nr:hypothetical protein CesoFtcFv8_017418 [Champsocephalus esox]KAK5916863.1 hypothetical protein CgunFtcFv8_011803 [Champsocephalus gunnari]